MKAIVYTSETGHTAAYARLLGEQTGLPVYELSCALRELEQNTPVLYLGWLFANSVKGYKIANKHFDLRAVCAVGLCDTGTALEQVRRVNKLDSALPLFTLQGGMDKTKLRGAERFVIGILTKAMESKKNQTPDDRRMVYLLKNDQNYVCEENLKAVLHWFSSQQ